MRVNNFLVPVVLSASVLLSACGGAEDRKASYIEQAEQSFEENNIEKSKLGYKNAIQIDPKDVVPRVGLAKVMVAAQDWRGAAGQFTGVLEIDPDHREAHLELGKLFLLARATEKANEHAETLLAKDPLDQEAKTLKAGVLAQQNKLAEAIAILEGVFVSSPKNIDNSVLYASLLSNMQRFDEALDVIEKAQSDNDESIDLSSIKVSIYTQQGKPQNAISELKSIIEKRPEVFEHKKRLVNYYMSLARIDDAAAELSSVIKQYEANESEELAMAARQALIDVYVQSNDIEKAQATLEEFIAQFPEEYKLQIGKARLSLGKGDVDSALSILNNVVERSKGGPSSIEARVTIANIYMAQQAPEKALSLLNEVLTEKPSTLAALKLRGQIAYTQRRFEDAVNDYRIVLKSDPDDAQMQKALADAHFQGGEYRLAQNYLKSLRRRFPQDLDILNGLAEVQERLGNASDSIALREEILLYVPNNAPNLISLAKLYAGTKQFEKLNSVAQLLQGSDEGKTSGYFFAGVAKQSEGEHEQAIMLFDQALEQNPTAIEPISAKTKSFVALKNYDAAIEWLDSLSAEADNPLALNLTGETFLVMGKPDQALVSLDRAIQASPKWVTPYRNKALVLRSSGDTEGALEALNTAISQDPSADSIRVEIAQLLEATGDIDGAIEQYERLYDLAGRSPLAANNLAMLLVTYKTDEQSMARAAKVAESLRGSSNPSFMDTLGWVYLKQNQVDLALPLIREAAERAPSVAQIQYHLAVAYHQKQDSDRAIKHLERALEEERGFLGRSDARELLEALRSQSS